jgi:hypothetical protein
MIVLLVWPAIGCAVMTPSSSLPSESAKTREAAVTPAGDEQVVTGDELQIVSTNAYRDVFGEWVVVGLIRNVADYPVGNATLQVVLFDAGGTPVYETNGYIADSGLVPGDGPVQPAHHAGFGGCRSRRCESG